MLKDAQGNLKIYSIGIVVRDKERNSDTIEVYPVEELPLAQGDLKETTNYDQTMTDSKNVPVQGKIEGKNYLTAKWIPFGHSNRITPPDVYANEHVILFRFADNEEYYWTTIYREPMFRRLETVCYMYSNLKEKMQEFTKESSYWFEVSTHDKKVQLHTSKSNGERYEYDVIINTGENYLIIKDSDDNFIRIVSTQDKIQLKANKIICLDAPVVRTGVGCGDSNDESYHDHAFVRTDDEKEHARIGNAWESYSHYDQDTLTTHTDKSINESTTDKVTKATASIVEETATKVIKATASITEEAVDKVTKISNACKLETDSYEHKSTNDVKIESDATIDLKADRVNIDNLHINGLSLGDFFSSYLRSNPINVGTLLLNDVSIDDYITSKLP